MIPYLIVLFVLAWISVPVVVVFLGVRAEYVREREMRVR